METRAIKSTVVDEHHVPW